MTSEGLPSAPSHRRAILPLPVSRECGPHRGSRVSPYPQPGTPCQPPSPRQIPDSHCLRRLPWRRLSTRRRTRERRRQGCYSHTFSPHASFLGSSRTSLSRQTIDFPSFAAVCGGEKEPTHSHAVATSHDVFLLRHFALHFSKKAQPQIVDTESGAWGKHTQC